MCVAILLNKATHVLLLILTTILRYTGEQYYPQFRDEDPGSDITRDLHLLQPAVESVLQHKPSADCQAPAPSCILISSWAFTDWQTGTQAQLLLDLMYVMMYVNSITWFKMLKNKRMLVWFMLSLNLGDHLKKFQGFFWNINNNWSSLT